MENPYYIQISQLIAAPMVAMVEGETIAANATKEFIETVGFTKQGNNDAILGEMRMVTFSYKRRNPLTDQIDDMSLSVPLLSLFSIPLLQIQNAEIEFGLDITTKPVVNNSSNSRFKKMQKKVEMYGMLRGTSGNLDTAVDAKIQMKVKINIAQSDIPIGLSKIFQVMDTSVTGKEK